MQRERRFEIRQANAVLSALVATADEGSAECTMSELADLAGISRVQAQLGLRILKDRGRVLHERRGTRNQPGRFRVLSDAPVTEGEPVQFQPVNAPHTRVVGDLREQQLGYGVSIDRLASDSRTLVALLEQENGALQREVAVLRERLTVMAARAETLERMLQQALERNAAPDTGPPWLVQQG